MGMRTEEGAKDTNDALYGIPAVQADEDAKNIIQLKGDTRYGAQAWIRLRDRITTTSARSYEVPTIQRHSSDTSAPRQLHSSKMTLMICKLRNREKIDDGNNFLVKEKK